MKKFLIFILFLELSIPWPALLNADVHVKTETTRLYMDFEVTYPNEVWLAEGKSYRKVRNGVFITRKDLGVMWYIDLGEKTYSEMKLEGDEAFEEQEEDIHTAGLFYNPTYDWEIKDTGEEKEINGFRSRCFLASGDADFAEIASTYWICVADNVPGGREFRDYMLDQVKNDPQRPKLHDIMLKYEAGFPVYREETIENAIAPTMIYKIKLLELEKAEAPPRIYDIPDGFKKLER
jgi:hypothetical protein